MPSAENRSSETSFGHGIACGLSEFEPRELADFRRVSLSRAAGEQEMVTLFRWQVWSRSMAQQPTAFRKLLTM